MFCFKDQHQETVTYQIDNENENDDNENKQQQQHLAQIFDLIEKNKVSLNIETYAVSQTTLEEVFLSFARLQKNDSNQKALFQRFEDKY